MVVSRLSVVPLKNGKNNCKPGETHRKTPSLCKIQTLDRVNLAEDGHQHSRGGLSKKVFVSYVHVSLTAEMSGKLKPEIIAILRDAGVGIAEGNS